jgi:hypothetical protein
MRYTRFRKIKVNVDNFESLDLGASVDFDMETEELPKGYSLEELPQYLDDKLDEVLEVAVESAKQVAIRDSHIFTLYPN